MRLRVSDEAIVGVKQLAVDIMVTWLRIKQFENDRMLEPKGGTH